MKFEDLTIVDGADNMAGIARIAYIALLEDIATLPDYKSSPALMGDYVTVENNFVMKSGKEFIAIEGDPKSGEVKDTKIEGTGNAYESSYEFFIPTTSPSNLGFAKLASNSKLVAIVIENDGNRRILGMKTPAILETVEGTTGKSGENNKGVTYTLKSYQNGPAPIYTGLIDNDSGSGSGI